MQKFLIIQTAFIGDVVLATGILEKLHSYFPDAEIDFMVRKGNETLLDDHPFVHEVLVWDKQKAKWKNLWTLLKKIRGRRYDKVINVQRFASTGLLSAFSGAKETIGFDKNPVSRLFTTRVKHVINTTQGTLHEIERNNDLVKHFTDTVVFKPRLYPSVFDYSVVKKFLHQPYICVAPSSVWFTKQYPSDKWVLFLKQIPGHFQVYLIGAPSDKDMSEKIMQECAGVSIANLCGELSFLQSAAIMQGAHMNFVNDSAPLHFASSVNAPVTAVYCSTLPSFGFGPLSDKSFIVEVFEKLPCRPCGLHGRKACPLAHFNCAYHIKEEQLLDSL